MEQGVIPMLAYANGPAALDFLAAAFGFIERDRRVDDDGRLNHGEMETDFGRIMLATPSPAYEGPAQHSAHCERARQWLEVPYIVDGVLVYVRDVTAHFERARKAGATILSEPEEGYPGLRYRAADPEGHRWMFMESERTDT